MKSPLKIGAFLLVGYLFLGVVFSSFYDLNRKNVQNDLGSFSASEILVVFKDAGRYAMCFKRKVDGELYKLDLPLFNEIDAAAGYKKVSSRVISKGCDIDGKEVILVKRVYRKLISYIDVKPEKYGNKRFIIFSDQEDNLETLVVRADREKKYVAVVVEPSVEKSIPLSNLILAYIKDVLEAPIMFFYIFT